MIPSYICDEIFDDFMFLVHLNNKNIINVINKDANILNDNMIKYISNHLWLNEIHHELRNKKKTQRVGKV